MRAKFRAMAYFLSSGMRNERRHCPSVLTKVNLAIITKPLRWVTVVGIHVCKRDREVNKVKIEIVKTPVLKLSLRRCLGLNIKILI
jgi:hypothetical protein